MVGFGGSVAGFAVLNRPPPGAGIEAPGALPKRLFGAAPPDPVPVDAAPKNPAPAGAAPGVGAVVGAAELPKVFPDGLLDPAAVPPPNNPPPTAG